MAVGSAKPPLSRAESAKLYKRIVDRVDEIESAAATDDDATRGSAKERSEFEVLRGRLEQRLRTGRDYGLLALVIVSLTIASVLLFWPLAGTDISLELQLRGIRLRVPQRQVWAPPLPLRSLSVSGIERAAAGPLVPAGLIAELNRSSSFTLRPVGESSSIAFPSIVISSGDVGIRYAGVPSHWELMVRSAEPVQASVSLQGTVSTSVDSGQLPNLVIPASDALVLFRTTSTQGRPINMEVALVQGTPVVLAESIAISGLTMDRTVTTEATSSIDVRILSDIMSGTLFYEGLGGQAREIHSGERLDFGTFDGAIDRLELAPDSLHVRIHGRVTDMTITRGSRSASAMPSVLDWLRAQQPLLLMWGAGLYLFGVLRTVRQWWLEGL